MAFLAAFHPPTSTSPTSGMGRPMLVQAGMTEFRFPELK
jgi:hypothetical protein